MYLSNISSKTISKFWDNVSMIYTINNCGWIYIRYCTLFYSNSDCKSMIYPDCIVHMNASLDLWLTIQFKHSLFSNTIIDYDCCITEVVFVCYIYIACHSACWDDTCLWLLGWKERYIYHVWTLFVLLPASKNAIRATSFIKYFANTS